jgi:hypothetical protein
MKCKSKEKELRKKEKKKTKPFFCIFVAMLRKSK